MATTNPFDLLVDNENDDPSQLIAAAASHQQKLAPPATKKAPASAQGVNAHQTRPSARMSSNPITPAQAVRQGRGENQRGGRGGGRGTGGRGFYRDTANGENTYGSNNGFSGGYRPAEDGDGGRSFERREPGAPRGGFRGGRRGGFSNGDEAESERPRRMYDRRSGTGQGNEFKREGSGRGNWETPDDHIVPEQEEPVNEGEKNVNAEKQVGQEDAGDSNKENPVNEPEKEPEDKEMTLEEYEKVLEEKRKALQQPSKAQGRKVGLDKEFESMQLLSSKKNDVDVFIKLGFEKDKRKEAADKEERARKAVSINEFLKPADGENYYRSGGRGRGRGRSSGGRGGNFGSNLNSSGVAPSIEDVGQFPSLGAK